MLASQIISEARGIITEQDPNNSHFTDATMLDFVNQCTLHLMGTIGTYPKVKTTLTVAEDVTLPESLLCIDYVAFVNESGNYTKLITKDFSNFVLNDPNWINSDKGLPKYFIRMDVNKWMLFPSPLTSLVGNDLVIFGRTLPADLTLTSQEPPISIALHSAYPHFLAWKCFNELNAPEKAVVSYKNFEAMRAQNLSIATSTRGTLKAFHLENY